MTEERKIQLDRIKYGALLSSLDVNEILESIEYNISYYDHFYIGDIPIKDHVPTTQKTVLVYNYEQEQFEFQDLDYENLTNLSKIKGKEVEEENASQYDILIYKEDSGKFEFETLDIDNLNNALVIQDINIKTTTPKEKDILVYDEQSEEYKVLNIISDREIHSKKLWSTSKIKERFNQLGSLITETKNLTDTLYEQLDRVSNSLIPKYEQMRPKSFTKESSTPSLTETFFSSKQNTSLIKDDGAFHGRGFILDIQYRTIINYMRGYATNADIGFVKMKSDWESGELMFSQTISGEEVIPTGGVEIPDGTKICVFIICPSTEDAMHGYNSSESSYNNLVDTSNYDNVTNVTVSDQAVGGHVVRIEGVGTGHAQDFANTTLKERTDGANLTPLVEISSTDLTKSTE